MKNIENSVYPQGIDPLIFFQDCNIDNRSTLINYYDNLSNNRFEEAANALNSSEVDFYGAWIWNLIENRLHTTEENIDVHVSEKPNLTIYGRAPSEDKLAHWISQSGEMNLYAYRITKQIPAGSTSVTFESEHLVENSLIMNYFSNIKYVTQITGDATTHTYTISFNETAEAGAISIIIMYTQSWGSYADRKPSTEYSGYIDDIEFNYRIATLNQGLSSINFKASNIDENSLILPVFSADDLQRTITSRIKVNDTISYYFLSSDPNKVAVVYLNDHITSLGSKEIYTDLHSFILSKTLTAGETSITFSDSRLKEDSCVVLYADKKRVYINSMTYNSHKLIFELPKSRKDIKLTLFVIN